MSGPSFALINPPDVRTVRMEERAAPPLGIASIGAVLHHGGYKVDLFDFGDKLNLSECFLDGVGFFVYDVYGFTSYTQSFPAVLQLAATLRRRRKSAVIVFGGPHATPTACELLMRHPEIDLIVRNEGEMPMLELASHLATGRPRLEEIGNLVFRSCGLTDRLEGKTAPGGWSTVRNPDYDDLPDLDSLPSPLRDYRCKPQRTGYESRRHPEPVRVEFISSSRGCPKRCAFCSIAVAIPTYRYRSAESIMVEVRDLYRRQPFGHISFLDANFFAHHRRALEFARALYDWNPAVTWSGTATADAIVRHQDVIGEIGRLNCILLEVGIENGSPSVLRRYNKRTTVSQNLEAIELLEEAGIDLDLDYILFDPETTPEELLENLEFLRAAELTDHHPNDHLCNVLRLFPGTASHARYAGKFDTGAFLEDGLIAPFFDRRTHNIYDIIMRFCEHRELIDGIMVTLDTECRRRLRLAVHAGECSYREVQILFCLLIQLRHAPTYLLEELVTLALEHQLDSNPGPGLAHGLEGIRRLNGLLSEVGQLLGSVLTDEAKALCSKGV